MNKWKKLKLYLRKIAEFMRLTDENMQNICHRFEAIEERVDNIEALQYNDSNVIGFIVEPPEEIIDDEWEDE